MNKYWIPGPITNYGTTDAGFAGEVRVVKAADYDALAARLAEAESECLEQARLNGMGSERESRLQARLAEAERLLLKFHTAGPAGITALIDEVPEFLGIAGWQRECICGPDETRGDCPEHGRFCIHGRLLDAHECDQPDTSRGSLRATDSAPDGPAKYSPNEHAQRCDNCGKPWTDHKPPDEFCPTSSASDCERHGRPKCTDWPYCPCKASSAPDGPAKYSPNEHAQRCDNCGKPWTDHKPPDEFCPTSSASDCERHGRPKCTDWPYCPCKASSAEPVRCPDCIDPDCAKGCAYADDDES